MSNPYQDERNSFTDKAKDFAKMFARRMIKDVAKKLLKKLAKMLLKVLLKALAKFAIWLLGFVGVPAILIFLCVIAFAGAAVFIGKTFGWLDDDSPVTAAELMARYQQSAQETADDPKYRVPVWLIQAIDNIRIVKEDKKPEEIDPEMIAKALKTITTEERKETRVSTWSNNSSISTVKTSQTYLTQVQTWNRKYTYTYTELTDEDTSINSMNSYGNPEYGGVTQNYSSQVITSSVIEQEIHNDYGTAGQETHNRYKSQIDVTSSSSTIPYKGSMTEGNPMGMFTSDKFSAVWANTGQDVQTFNTYEGTNSIKTYYYALSQNIEPGESIPINLSNFPGASSYYNENHRQSTRWILSDIKEEPNFEKFDALLLSLHYTRSDFDFLQAAIEEDDPALATITGYFLDHLPSDDLNSNTDGNGTYVGGKLPDAPNIPLSSEWVFPTNKNAIIGDGYGSRFDPVKNKIALHKGQDISRSASDKSNNVDYINFSVADGIVAAAGDAGDGYGNKVVIDHGGDIQTLYGHMKSGSLQVRSGDQVKKGQALGIMGATGMATGIHLHFEVLVNGNPVNPIGYLRR